MKLPATPLHTAPVIDEDKRRKKCRRSNLHKLRNMKIIMRWRRVEIRYTCGAGRKSQSICGYQKTITATHVERQGLAAVLHLVTVDADKSLAVLEKTTLQTDDNELHARGGVVMDVVGDTGHVGVIKGSVDFVEYEEG